MKETVKKIALVKTNLFVCTVIILGFAVTSLISYHSNQGLFKQETENVSNLTAEGIYHKIESIHLKLQKSHMGQIHEECTSRTYQVDDISMKMKLFYNKLFV